MNDREVIKAFVNYLQRMGHPDLQVERWPEDENRESQEIDAIAGVFAIEHTSIDTLPDQRRDSDWFVQVVGGLEQELSRSMPFRLSITVEYKAITKRQSWSAIRSSLKSWVVSGAPLLEDGDHVLDGVPGVPFRIHVLKASGRSPGIFFARFDPGDDTLAHRVRKQLERKAKKLLKYKCIDMITVLLIENDDIALMDESKMLMAVREAYPDGPPPGVDQLWYADTSIADEIWFRNFTFNPNQENRPTTAST